MEQRNQRIEALLERYFEAQTTTAEERELREFFSGGNDIPRQLRYVQTMFCGLGALAAETAAECDALAKNDFVELESCAKLRPTISRRRLCIWGGAVAAAVTAVGIFMLASYMNRPYCYINGVPVRDAETAMQATVYFEQLEVLDKPLETLDEIMKQIQKEKI